MVAGGLDALNFGGGRIQASGDETLQGVGVLRGGTMVAPACSCKKRREDEGEGERKPGGRRETRGGTTGSCAASFSGEEQIGHGRSREWAAFGDGGAGRGARGASS